MGFNISSNTFRLFKKIPSFTEGFSSMIERKNFLSVYNIDNEDENVDSKAIHSDWLAVGEDINTAMKIYDKEKKEKTQIARAVCPE